MRIVVLGTGTNAGKTHLGVTLLTHLTATGHSTCGLKPIESGVPAGAVGPDAEALAAAGSMSVSGPQPYAFPDAVSPHLAARRAGVTVKLERARLWVDAHTAADWLLIETAGALLSPVSPTATNLDLAASLAPDAWILVAVDRLGVLHDVAACMVVLRSRGVAPAPLVVLQAPATPDDSTGTNAEELVLLGTAPRVLTMPRGEPSSAVCQAAASGIVRALRGAGR